MASFRSSIRTPRLILVLAIFLISGQLFAQSAQTGAISGTVTTADGVAIPGVTVTVSSSVLQGTRTAYSGDNGTYIVRGLPPGNYSVAFTLEGMTSVKSTASVELGGTSKVDIKMLPAATSEAITVTAEAPTLLTTTQLGTNLNREQIQELPIPRGGGTFLSNIAALTPGVNNLTTFNAGQIRVNGGFGYDNVFLVDGTDVNDNLFGTAHNLYIEDAIAETQVLTGGVSAEYGRFTGGVVNVVTKSGGNDFTGTGRADVTNPSWRDETPYEDANGIKRTDKNSSVYSATLGGPLMRDHLWFFLAGRRDNTTESRTLLASGIGYDFSVENPRYEGKITGTVANQSLQFSYLDNKTTQANNIGLAGRAVDPAVFVTRSLPNKRWAAFYNGIITQNLFSEVKYSEKTFGFRNTGGTSTDIHDSPFLTRSHSPSRHYNAPFFDSSDPEDRNNKDLTASLSYFLGTKRIGTHDIKGGYEKYTSTRTGGNSQSSTGYVFNADYKAGADGKPALDAQGRVIPVWAPFISGSSAVFTTLVNWLPVRGASVDINTDALYLTDTWTINPHFTFTAGGRFEDVTGEATGSIDTVDSTRFTPRLALAIDPMANGRYKIDLTYAQYAGKFSERQFAQNTNVGTPNSVTMRYIGPPGEGIDFAPGFDLNNYEITTGSFPLQNVIVDPDIKSPIAKEWTVSGGAAIGTKGSLKLTYTTRDWSDFWEDFINTSTGFTAVKISDKITRNLDNTLFSNTSALARKYEAIQVLSNFRVLRNWAINGNYTLELKNDGNFVGEAGNQPGNPSIYGDYPEIFNEARHYPKGKLPGYQKHRVRILNSYSMDLHGAGKLDLGLVFGYDSANTFSYAASSVPTTTQQKALLTAAGYKSPPTSQTLFFDDRGTGEFDASHQFDFAANYAIPVFGRLAPWVKLEVYNLTNEQALRAFDTTVSVDPNSAKDELGLPTGYIKGSKFGQARTADDYQVPREYRLSVGFRF